MHIRLARAAIVATAIALAGCAAQTPPVQVTRFHLGQPIAPGEVAVEPRNPVAANSLEFQTYANAAAALPANRASDRPRRPVRTGRSSASA